MKMIRSNGGYFRYLLVSIIVLGVIIISAVAYHSVGEIHYLKTFFPDQFSVQEARDASIIELVKVSVISIPLVLIIIICLVFIKKDIQRR